MDVLHCQDHGQAFLLSRPHDAKRRPLAMQGVFVEAFDTANRLSHRGAGPMLDIFDVQEILAEFFFGDLFRRFLNMVGQLAHGSTVSLLGALGHAQELQVFQEALAQGGGNVGLLPTRRGLEMHAPVSFEGLRIKGFEATEDGEDGAL